MFSWDIWLSWIDDSHRSPSLYLYLLILRVIFMFSLNWLLSFVLFCPFVVFSVMMHFQCIIPNNYNYRSVNISSNYQRIGIYLKYSINMELSSRILCFLFTSKSNQYD